MKTVLAVIVLAASIVIISSASAQDTPDNKAVFPSGITVGYGLGSYSVKDEYISREKYSGTLPRFSLGWVRFHDKAAYRLEFQYRNSGDISNNNISAEVRQFTFNQDFVYFIGSFPISSRGLLVPNILDAAVIATILVFESINSCKWLISNVPSFMLSLANLT